MHRFLDFSPNRAWKPVSVNLDEARHALSNLATKTLPALERFSQQPWQSVLIYVAIAAQILNMLMAIYMTSFMAFGDVLLDVFGTWNLALLAKGLAFGLWLNQRDRLEARVAAWVIAPLSVLALGHDLLLLCQA